MAKELSPRCHQSLKAVALQSAQPVLDSTFPLSNEKLGKRMNVSEALLPLRHGRYPAAYTLNSFSLQLAESISRLTMVDNSMMLVQGKRFSA